MLPIGIKIEREDFTHKNKGTVSGTTLFGYLLRNEIICTDAKELSFCELNVDDVVLVDKEQSEIEQIKEQSKQIDKKKSKLKALKNLYGGKGLTMTSEQGESVLRTEEEVVSFEQKIKEYFDKVLGKNGNVEFSKEDNEYLSQYHDKNVLAACGIEVIKMSKFAPDDAMFHESFHKILELIVPNKTRESFYEAYRKEYGYGLSERDVAEGLCDEFVGYINNRNYYKNKGGVWSKIGAWFKFMTKNFGIMYKYGLITGIKMLSVFRGTRKGEYANKEITEDKKKRFKEKFGDVLYYQVKNRETGNTMEFDNITNSSDLREVAEAIATIILMRSGIEDYSFDASKLVVNRITPSLLLQDPYTNAII